LDWRRSLRRRASRNGYGGTASGIDLGAFRRPELVLVPDLPPREEKRPRQLRPARILIADSSPILRSGVGQLLTAEGGFDVLEAKDLEELQRAVAEKKVDLALVDLELPPAGGISAIARLSGFCSAPLVAWGFASDKEVKAARLAGASAYLRKDVPFAPLESSLRDLIARANRTGLLARAAEFTASAFRRNGPGF
jgi:DNA-binding NarL/FixJ family response regulator